ncbi:MAG TPA: dihydroorotase [Hyphomonadaceae bacterium]|nr:dihydroorotase [Hyphomonadaceae bacterium]
MTQNSPPSSLLLRGARAFLPGGPVETDILVKNGLIAGLLSPGAPAAAEDEIHLKGLTILPGVIDTQVHFREPGLTHKEDLESGSRAAVLGGVTAVFEMPNTNPPTTTPEKITEKLRLAAGRMHCDHAFYAGASPETIDLIPEVEAMAGVCGVKMFMGSSTGSLLVAEEDQVRAVLAKSRRRVAVHSEDEERLKMRKSLARPGDWTSHPEVRDAECAWRATERLIGWAREAKARVHVLHVTTAEEMAMLATAKDVATVETTPQHLTFTAPEIYARLGGFAQMNPPIRDLRHQQALWDLGIGQGVVDVIGTDHAPHTRAEKAQSYPASPSGMPGVQTLVAVMLTHVAQGRLSLARCVDLLAAGPARVFGMVGKGRIALGMDADFTIVDLDAARVMTHEQQATRCGWTPFDGFEAKGWPIATMLRGAFVMRDGEVTAAGTGQPLRFFETQRAPR